MFQDKPLVTIAMMTYNQEKYVRDSVRGMLAQTYEPLEIIISDDCSTDQTWDIVNEEVDKYKAVGGIHKNIVLNRNKNNLGIAAHAQKVSALEHGMITIDNGGDDISFPNRVEKIVDAWEKSGRTFTLLHHGYVEIDERGRELGKKPPRSAKLALGATCAYVKDVKGVQFPPIADYVTIEDQVFAKRALLRGPEARLDEPLVYYRIGVGVSNSFKTFRQKLIVDGETMVQSCRQLMVDLEYVKNVIDKERYSLVKNMVDELLIDYQGRIDMAAGRNVAVRIKGLWARIKSGTVVIKSCGFIFRDLMFVLPKWVGDPIINLYEKVRARNRVARKG